MKITGRRHTDARFMASCTAPIEVAPSPKFTMVTRFSWRSCAAMARPLAIGVPAPTIAVVSIDPDLGSEIWGEPPLPLLTPSARPRISQNKP
jgi:hypothetical protein